MADVMRYRKEFNKPRFFAVDSATVIAVGDLVWLDTDDVKPASDFTWDTNIATTQRAFAKKFVGIAIDRSRSGDTDPIQVNMEGVHELTCASATFELEGYLAPAKASGNALENQKVVAVTDPTLAIGKVAKREPSAVTTVELEIYAGKEPGNYNTPEELRDALETLGAGSRLDSDYIDEGSTNKFASTTNVAAAGAVMDSDFSAAEGFMRKTGAGAYTVHKSNLTAVIAPTVNDDNTAGYSAGSVWLDTVGGGAYICVSAATGAASWASYMTAAQISKLAGIEALADVTDATNVAAAGAVMDSDITPGEGILRKTGAGAYTAHKTNLAAAVAPTVNDDTTAGYSVGSIWLDTTADNGYICIDASTGAAVWLLWMSAAQVTKLAGIEALADVTDATNVAAAGAVMDSDITPGEGILRKTGAGAYTAHKTNLAAIIAPTVNDDNVAGYSVGSLWIDVTGDMTYRCVDASTGAAVWLQMLTQANAAKIANCNAEKQFFASYTCIAGDATAGYADINTGFGAAPEGWLVQVMRAGVNVTEDAIVTALGGGDAGKIRVADGGVTYVLTAGDIINLHAFNVV